MSKDFGQETRASTGIKPSPGQVRIGVAIAMLIVVIGTLAASTDTRQQGPTLRAASLGAAPAN
jgi:hypothetical protein